MAIYRWVIGLALVLLWGDWSTLRADPNLVVEIERAETPPVVDGALVDWVAIRWISFAPDAAYMSDISRQLRLNHDGATEPPGTAHTAADLSGTFALQWDDDWIYMAVRVTDNVHDVSGGTDAQWYQKDAVSLFLDIPLDGDGLEWIRGDHVFSFVADQTYPDYGKWWRCGSEDGPQELRAPAETRMAVRRGKGGDYVLEAAIPMKTLTELGPGWHPPFTHQVVGFMLLVTDPDGGSNPFGGQLMYGGDDDDDAQWAKLRFRPVGAAAPPHIEFAEELAAGADRADPGTISGTVVTQKAQKPYPGFEIEAYRNGRAAGRAWTDADGQYHLVAMPGEYTLKPGRGQGFKPFEVQAIAVAAGQKTFVDLVLEDWGSSLHVDGGTLEGGNGSMEHPFRTIQQALNAVGPGDTIRVAAGIYREPVELVVHPTSSASISGNSTP